MSRYLENANRFPDACRELNAVCTQANAMGSREGKVPLFVEVSVETFEQIGVISFHEVVETMWKLFADEIKSRGYA